MPSLGTISEVAALFSVDIASASVRWFTPRLITLFIFICALIDF